MPDQKKLIIEQLDRKLRPFYDTKTVQIPERGWVHTIRTSLNMTLKQLGNKLKISSPGVKDMEERESTGSITIKTLREVGEALDMQFVYGFVPHEDSIGEFIEKKAIELATRIVQRTNINMILEDQGNSEERLKQAVNDLAIDITREMRRSLWD